MRSKYILIVYDPKAGDKSHKIDTDEELIEALSTIHQRTLQKSVVDAVFAESKDGTWVRLGFDEAMRYAEREIEKRNEITCNQIKDEDIVFLEEHLTGINNFYGKEAANAIRRLIAKYGDKNDMIIKLEKKLSQWQDALWNENKIAYDEALEKINGSENQKEGRG